MLEDRPPTPDGNRLQQQGGYPARAEQAVAAGARLVEAPTADEAAALGRAADLVVPSPGVHPDHPALAAAHAAGVPIRSEIDLAAARLRARPDAPRLVAVTGTNGKTTVTTLIDAMLRAAGIASVAAGNIGRPLLDAAGDRVAVVVAEVSSFQLALDRQRVRSRRRRPAERRRGPPRLARVGRRLRRGQGPRVREPGEPGAARGEPRRPRRRRPGRHRPRPGDPVRDRRAGAGRVRRARGRAGRSGRGGGAACPSRARRTTSPTRWPPPPRRRISAPTPPR